MQRKQVNNMNLKEEKVKSDFLYDGRIIKLYNDEIRLPDGNQAYREYVRHPGGVCVVPLTDKYEVMLVRQYRYVYGQELIEIPAGKRDGKNEDTLVGAKRELKEELGIEAENFVFLGEMYPTPGYTDEVLYMYAATGLHFGDTSPDEDEFIEPEKIHIDKLVDMIMNGEIKDAKTIGAVLKTKKLLDENKEVFCVNLGDYVPLRQQLLKTGYPAHQVKHHLTYYVNKLSIL